MIIKDNQLPIDVCNMLMRPVLSSLFLTSFLLNVYGNVITPESSRQIDRFISEEMEKRNIPGLALAICLDGKVLKEAAFGLADVQNNASVTISTRFELASITKQFTASAIMILYQWGGIDLDAGIHAYLADAPQNWQSIKVKHLLNHTSGLPTLGQDWSARRDPDFVAAIVEETGSALNLYESSSAIKYRMAKEEKLHYNPGESFLYSDVGYFLLGMIIERVSGTTYREFLEEHIFKPAGMNDTYILDREAIHSNEARGYTLKNGKLINIRRWYNEDIPSHYGIFSNVLDMAKWNEVLGTEIILNAQSKNRMWSPSQLEDESRFPYGFGWFTFDRYGQKFLTHTGITGTEIIRFLEDGLCIVLLTNQGQGLGLTSGARGDAWGLAPQIAKMIGRKTLTDRDYVTLDGAAVTELNSLNLNNWIGQYRNSGGMGLSIKKEARGLFYQIGSKRAPLAALDNGTLLVLNNMNEQTLEWVTSGDDQDGIGVFINGQRVTIFNLVRDCP